MPVPLNVSPMKQITSTATTTTSKYQLRSVSLDRPSSRETSSYSSRYSSNNSSYSSSYSSSKSHVSSLPPRPLPSIHSSGYKLSTRSPIHSTTSSKLGTTNSDPTSPVLTKYRGLSDSCISLGSDTGYQSSRIRTSASSYSNRGLSNGLTDSSSSVSSTSRHSSSSNLSDHSNGYISTRSTLRSSSPISSRSAYLKDVDENSNNIDSKYIMDTNRNVFNSTRRSTSPVGSRWKNLASSDSSMESGCGSLSSSDNSSPPPERSRRSSTSSDYGSTSSILPSKSSDKKKSLGLRNLGNTCFMNSVLQCLSHTQPLVDYCLHNSYLRDINTTFSTMKGALMKAYASLIQSLWKSESAETAISPHNFKSEVQRFAPRFMGYSQQDAQEFLRYLIQGLHEDVNRITSKPRPNNTEIDDNLSESQKATESWKRYLNSDDSKIMDLFVGQLKSTLHCTTCGYNSITFDPFWDLSLPIPKGSSSVSLKECLSLFTKEEVLDGDEKPMCSKCKSRQKCTKSFSIYRFPQILVLHLKRFSPGERFRAKLNTKVDFPLTSLDIWPYASKNGKGGYSGLYNLYAVSNHSGSTYSGHYTAYCRHPVSGEWHEFNDARVSSITAKSVVSSEAYVLFYELASQSSRL